MFLFDQSHGLFHGLLTPAPRTRKPEEHDRAVLCPVYVRAYFEHESGGFYVVHDIGDVLVAFGPLRRCSVRPIIGDF